MLEERACMPHARTAFGCCVSGQSIYTAGGTIEKQVATSFVECYDTEKDSWSILPNLPYPLFSLGLSTFNNSLIVVGGSNAAYKPEAKIMQLSLDSLDAEWKALNVTLPKPTVTPGI